MSFWRIHPLQVISLTAMLALLLALGWWSGELRARSLDAEMRKDLLRQAAEIANTVNPAMARQLTFTEADKDSPVFEQLRKHLIAAGRLRQQRGIYSMALREGRLFFGPENYAENDPMASPPGTVYRYPPAEFIRIFSTKRSAAVGPVTDEYGTFVSAGAPVLDPYSKEVLMAVGVDILATDWQARLDAARRWPLLASLSLVLLVVGIAAAIRWRNRRMKPGTLKLKAWIVAPTALAMLGGLMLHVVYDYQEFEKRSQRNMRRVMEQARGQLKRTIASEVQILKAQIDHIADNPEMLKSWQDQDLSALTDLALPIHEKLKREYRISHFYFMAPDRTIFLRVHRPDLRGDTIDRATLITAARTGEDAWGIELGPLGSFTLRYVRPWKQRGMTAGYLELGMEIEHLAMNLARDMDLDLLTILHKKYTTREKFEAGSQAFGFAGRWDAYSDFVITHQTTQDFPEEVAHWLAHEHNPDTEIGIFKARLGQRQYACGSIHLPDETGRGVADLVVLQDVTGEADAARSNMLESLGLAASLLGGLLALLWSVTGNAERHLGAAFESLRAGEKRLSQSNQVLTGVLEHTHMMAVLLDPQFNFIWVNRAYADSCRHEPSFFPGKNHFQLYPHEENQAIFQRVVDTGEPFFVTARPFEFPDQPERGVTYWDWSLIPIKEPGRIVAALVFTLVEVTERKRAEAALTHSHNLMRYIIEHSRSAVAVHDRDLNYIYVSQRYLDDYKVRERDIIGKHHYEVFPDLPQKWRDVHQRALAGEVCSAEDDPYVREDGSVEWTRWECRPWHEVDGTIGGIIVSTEVITDRKRAEQEIRDSEERNRRLIEASTDAIIVRFKGTITYANPAALKLFRATRMEELIGRHYLDLVHPDDRAGSAARVKKSIDENWVAPPREHRILALDGQVVDVESTGVPVQHQNETLIFGVFRDITDRKRSDQEREKLEGQLRLAQKMEAIGTLAGGIAHDFNNILSVIIGNSDLLALTDEIPPSAREGINQISAASQRAKQLVKQILTFSRQSEQQKLLINLKPVIKETIGFLRASLPATIQLEHYAKPDVGAIMADPTQMQQVLLNLCTNAAHAMEERGGILRIELDNAAISEENARLSPGLEAGSYVRLAVSDTGHGMERRILERIFDPYFTTKGPGKGTGLGLSVVHGIVKSHGGMLKVYSEAGRGTIFHVFFPKVDGVEKAETKTVPRLPRGTEKILFVDDEAPLAALGKKTLEFLGYRVEVRTSPIEALELFRANPERFDAVITDMTMPQLTGLGLAREVLAIKPGIPVILCTGFSEQANEARMRAAGIRALLFKPVVIEDLVIELRKVLDAK